MTREEAEDSVRHTVLMTKMFRGVPLPVTWSAVTFFIGGLLALYEPQNRELVVEKMVNDAMGLAEEVDGTVPHALN